MSGNNNETHSWLVQITIYSFGVIAGIGAKLALIARKRDISIRDIVINTTLAFAAAIIVWHGLRESGYDEYAPAVSVFCGRFADDFLRVGWIILKKVILDVADETKKID